MYHVRTSLYNKYPTIEIKGNLTKSIGITTETGARLNAFVIHRCAVKPVIETTSRNGKSVLVGILISKSVSYTHLTLPTILLV